MDPTPLIPVGSKILIFPAEKKKKKEITWPDLAETPPAFTSALHLLM